MARAARKPSRARMREQLLAEAAAIALPDAVDVCVCGGGAAGLAAAIAAAEAGAAVLVLERGLRCGESILATGNGRCNLSNRALAPEAFNDPDFVRAAFGSFGCENILAFFAQCGLATICENGRIYPASNQAASVREVLLARARRGRVIFGCARELEGIEGGTIAFRELFSEERHTLAAGAVVLACREGYLPDGLAAAPFTPALCPIAAEGLPFKELDGRRVHARAALMRRGVPVLQEEGEVLFRSYGLSGIVIFDLSRAACPGDTIELDLAPALDDALFFELTERAGSARGIIDPSIVDVMGSAKHLSCTVTGLAQTEHAQVRRGGLATAQFDPATLMAYGKPGLFAAGEVLDIDGPCGGYNLSWAWRSGQIAGTAAAA
ncbi:MAG TPA: NAD(P)/FAD-dependent oxidoreductase, partial [Atopobiaceae bacterium]|nr:NAD(P)/FAD-dependent oxidoreductase [Atopobiaceae bacterium]